MIASLKTFNLIILFVCMALVSCKHEYNTETLQYNIGQTRFTGTFYKPLTPPPYPLIVLAQGSGKGVRSSFYYTPYGEYFSKNGIAVFIFDKRGVGDSEGIYDENPAFNLLASDLQATYKFIINRPDIDKSKAGILGISQAGWVVPIALQHLDNVSFTVCTSCPLVPPYQSDLFQKGRELAESGYAENDIEEILNYNRSVTEYVATFEGREKVILLKQKYKDRKWFKDFEYNPGLLPEDSLKKPLFNHYRKSVFEPKPYWRNLSVPLLFIYGEKDSHIPVEQSILQLNDSLKTTTFFRIHQFKNTGHLIQTVDDSVELLNFNLFSFIKGKPKPIPEYLDYVKTWILEPKK